MSALNGLQRGPASWRPGRGGTLRRLRGDDRGAVATVFGILLAGGVLVGMLALVVDVGQLYAEREELQTGADAAALAIAKSCAKQPDECKAENFGDIADDYADGNAKDGAANALEICGSIDGASGLTSCDTMPSPDNLTKCLGDPPARYLEVRTTTALPDETTLLPPIFAKTLLGNGGYDGATVRACARVAWGAPKAGLAVTFSKCEWDEATNNGTDFPSPPPYPPNTVPDGRYEVVLRTHDAKDPASLCPDESGPAGWDVPGGFGWLDDGGSEDCNTDDFTPGPTGVMEKRCTELVLNPITDSASVAKVVYIPIYDTVSGTGSKAKYNIIGMAAFVPTGYFFGTPVGKRKVSWLTGKDYGCSGEDRCLFGYFVDVLQPGPVETGPLESLGATVISLVG